jgi:hypothetical protein
MTRGKEYFNDLEQSLIDVSPMFNEHPKKNSDSLCFRTTSP